MAAEHAGRDDTRAPAQDYPATLRAGRYRITNLLGEGSQAQTLEAEDTSSGARVAIKRFSVRGAKSWKDVELAEREARVLAALRHPSLPAYLDHFEEDGALYLVMEKIEGPTLAELRRQGALDQELVLRFLSDAAETLAYLHSRSPPIIHRDIKPQNVIRRPDGSFALVDFGSVRDQLRPEGGSTVVGTFGFMAPEQFQGRALAATDLYGVGATALACLAGQDPDKLPHRGLAIDVRAALGGRIEPRLVDLVARLLEPEPERRPMNFKGAVSALRARRSQSELPPPRPTTNTASDRFEREFRELRRLRKRERRAQRRAQRSLRHDGSWRRQAGPIGPLILLVVMLGLLVARIATFALFRIALPFVLGILAIVFGGGLRRAAQRCAEIGRLGGEALERAMLEVRGERQRALREGPSPGPPRFRVEASRTPGPRVPNDDGEDEITPTPSARREQRR
jgi:tRNA A-37 threonylcarbamoyl transferase component Bud32